MLSCKRCYPFSFSNQSSGSTWVVVKRTILHLGFLFPKLDKPLFSFDLRRDLLSSSFFFLALRDTLCVTRLYTPFFTSFPLLSCPL